MTGRPGSVTDLELAVEMRSLRDAIEQQTAVSAKQNSVLSDLSGDIIKLTAAMDSQRDRCNERMRKVDSDIKELKAADGEVTQTRMRSLEQRAEAAEAKAKEAKEAKKEVVYALLKFIGALATGGVLVRVLEAMSK